MVKIYEYYRQKETNQEEILPTSGTDVVGAPVTALTLHRHSLDRQAFTSFYYETHLSVPVSSWCKWQLQWWRLALVGEISGSSSALTAGHGDPPEHICTEGRGGLCR